MLPWVVHHTRHENTIAGGVMQEAFYHSLSERGICITHRNVVLEDACPFVTFNLCLFVRYQRVGTTIDSKQFTRDVNWA
jgi:hypothetical protein